MTDKQVFVGRHNLLAVNRYYPSMIRHAVVSVYLEDNLNSHIVTIDDLCPNHSRVSSYLF